MPINPNDYTSTPSNWFETEIEYQGIGIARFENPTGYIQGMTTAHFDEIGEELITMKIDKFECETYLETKNSQNDTLMWLINGRKPKIEGVYAIHGIGAQPTSNCTSLEITTPDGIFRAIGKIHHSQIYLGDDEITFYIISSEYQSQNEQDAAYWVMPLTNFVSQDLTTIHRPLQRHELDRHPLRIYPTPIVPLDLSHEELLSALSHANYFNCIINFEFEGKSGFIERLKDYSERAEKLRRGQVPFLLTSVMVGECDNKLLDWDQVLHWIPLEFLHMLSLTSGSLVGISWIEFRSASGLLLRRIHTQQWQAPYNQGHTAIDNFSGGGIGLLLSKAPIHIGPELRSAIILTVKAGQRANYLEDALESLFRAADTLTKDLRTNPTPDETILLEANRKVEIKNIIVKAGRDIRETKKKATDKELKIIERIAQRVSGAMSLEKPNEGQALRLLIEECELKDFLVIDDISKWEQRYNKYRNQVIHESYLTKEFPPDEALPLFFHLHDVLIRIILKKLNYDGEYRKAIPLKKNQSVDWVESKTQYDELWYQKF